MKGQQGNAQTGVQLDSGTLLRLRAARIGRVRLSDHPSETAGAALRLNLQPRRGKEFLQRRLPRDGSPVSGMCCMPPSFPNRGLARTLTGADKQ